MRIKLERACCCLQKKKEESEEKDHEKSDVSKSKTESEGGFGNLAGTLGMALASSLASNALQGNTHAQQGYPPQQGYSPQQQSGGGSVLDSIFGALGRHTHIHDIFIYAF